VGGAGLTVVVRAAGAADLAAVSSIFAWYVEHTVATFEESPRDASEWSALLARLDGLDLPFLVAEADGVIGGYAYASPWRGKPAYRHTVEDSVFVAHDQVGQGLGRILLGDLLDRCAKSGARQMVAIIADTGEPHSVALHEAFGFTAAGRLKEVGYKHGRWIDTLLMQRPI
jgi:L-amino acid N-acyltransferase YncA